MKISCIILTCRVVEKNLLKLYLRCGHYYSKSHYYSFSISLSIVLACWSWRISSFRASTLFWSSRLSWESKSVPSSAFNDSLVDSIACKLASKLCKLRCYKTDYSFINKDISHCITCNSETLESQYLILK